MAKIDTSVRPFSGKDEWGYIFGDMAGSFVNLYVDAYFLTFCTYALGINASFMTGLFLVARLWDAIPTVCYALILVGIGLIFNLNKKKTDQMYAEMAAKREASK